MRQSPLVGTPRRGVRTWPLARPCHSPARRYRPITTPLELWLIIIRVLVDYRIMIRRHITDHLLEMLEDNAGRLVGVEIKAGATLGGNDVRGLQALAAAVGKRWLRGVVLYTGTEVIPFAGNLHALPLPLLWAAHKFQYRISTSVIGMAAVIVTATTIAADGRGFGLAAATRTFDEVRGLNLSQKLLPAVIAAKVICFSCTFSTVCRHFVQGHSANRVFGHQCAFSFLVRDGSAAKPVDVVA
jgi:hypothetical protein